MNQRAPCTADTSSDNVLFVAVAAGLGAVAGGAGHVDGDERRLLEIGRVRTRARRYPEARKVRTLVREVWLVVVGGESGRRMGRD